MLYLKKIIYLNKNNRNLILRYIVRLFVHFLEQAAWKTTNITLINYTFLTKIHISAEEKMRSSASTNQSI